MSINSIALPLADEPRQSLCSAVSGHQTEIDFRLTEPRRVGRNTERAGHGEFATAAQRVAVDRRDHRLAEILDQVEHVLAGQRVIASRRRRLLQEFVDVGAGDERLVARIR